MLKIIIRAFSGVAILALSGAACAIGLGSMSVATGLGEPLKAEIELVAVNQSKKDDLSVRLASPEAFKSAGMEYPGSLPKLKFQIETHADGSPYLSVSTAQPVNEPFVNLLVELNWASGRLLREYTFLLDPPGFKPEQPKAVEVQPLEPAVAVAEEAKPEVVQEETLPIRASAPMDAEVFAAAEKAVTKKTVASAKVVAGPVTVKRGDTLSKIARETKPSDVSLERMLVALYRANEDQFDANNMNRIREGKILSLPERDDLNEVEQAEAVKEIRIQAADWHAYRQKLAAASGSSMEQASGQESSGKISTTVADKTPEAKQTAKEVVRLSKGEAPGDKAVGSGNEKALQDKVHAMEEEATVRNKELKDSSERIAMLEKNINEMQRLVKLKGELASVVENKPEAKPAKSKAEASEPAKPTESPVAVLPAAPASAVAAPAKPVVKPAVKPVPKVVTPTPSLLDEILGEPLYLASAAAVLLGLGGAGFMLARRRGKTAKSIEDESAFAHIAEPVAPSPDTGDFTHVAAAIDEGEAEETDDVDPISEADLFLNFGRDVQAEEILKDALKKNPANQQVRLKLLSIYANRKDTKTFASVAQQVLDSGDAAAWTLAAEMGHKLEPANPMYGGDDSAGIVAEDTALDEAQAEQTVSSLDFDLGSAEQDDAVSDEADATSTTSGLDFDLGLAGESEEAHEVAAETTEEPLASAQTDTSVMDFDIGFQLPTEEDTAAVGSGDNNSSALDARVDDEPGVDESQTEQDSALDFDITSTPPEFSIPQEEPTPQQTPEPEQDHSLEELAFDISEPPLSPAAMMDEVAQAEQEPEPEEAMEFTLDFPGTEEAPADEAATEPAVAKEVAIDLSDIDLNVGEQPAEAPEEEVKDPRWHDVATKLDLARAYQEMGDASGAREILEEVVTEGDAQQRMAAEVMLQQLPA